MTCVIGERKRVVDAMWTIAIGDIHGHADKLTALLVVIDRWSAEFAPRQSRQIIFIGDYIDRGTSSREVLRTVRDLQDNGAICLRGNHEDLMIRSVNSELDRKNFLVNGGIATVRSLGTAAAFAEAREWMLGLPLSYEDDTRYFVHAGVRPELPLSEQSARDQMWIRDVFLAHKAAFSKYVVHGHTPIKSGARLPEVLPNRCNLDAGAAWSGPLSAAVFDDRAERPVWLLNSESQIVAV